MGAGELSARLEEASLPLACAYLGGRGTVALAETAVEIGLVVESDLERDGTNRQIGKAPVGQETVGPRQAPTEHELGEAHTLGLEQPLNIAHRQTMAGREHADRNILPANGLLDIGLD